MSNLPEPTDPLEVAAQLFENGAMGFPSLEGGGNDGNYGQPAYEAADSLAKVLELFKADPGYAETLGVSKRGMDFIAGAEATLRAASIDL